MCIVKIHFIELNWIFVWLICFYLYIWIVDEFEKAFELVWN